MAALAQAVYEFVATNPGEKSSAIVAGLTSFCQATQLKPKSVQAYLSLLKKAKLLKVMPSNPDGSGALTYYVHRKWNEKLLAEVMPGPGKRRFARRPLPLKVTQPAPAKAERADQRVNKHGVRVLELEVGNWVELEWNDAPNEPVLILSLEHRLDTYKGERTIGTLHKDADGWYTRMASAGSSQVVRVLGTLTMPRFPK